MSPLCFPFISPHRWGAAGRADQQSDKKDREKQSKEVRLFLSEVGCSRKWITLGCFIWQDRASPGSGPDSGGRVRTLRKGATVQQAGGRWAGWGCDDEWRDENPDEGRESDSGATRAWTLAVTQLLSRAFRVTDKTIASREKTWFKSLLLS